MLQLIRELAAELNVTELNDPMEGFGAFIGKVEKLAHLEAKSSAKIHTMLAAQESETQSVFDGKGS